MIDITALPANYAAADALHDDAHTAITTAMARLSVMYGCRLKGCCPGGEPYPSDTALIDVGSTVDQLIRDLQTVLRDAEPKEERK
jgi:hypothetical protein